MLPIRVPFRLTLLIVLWSAEGYYDQTIDVTSLADVRADLCDVSAQLTAGNISIRESLKGKRLTFVHALYYPYDWYYEDEDGTPHGFHSDLADALSRAAGFEYTVVAHESALFQAQNITWDEYLYLAVDAFDASLEWWLQTPDRMSTTRIPFPFLDLSIVSSKYVNASTDPFTAVTFLHPFDPFTYRLWGTVFGTAVATALVYTMLERNADEDSQPCYRFGGNVFNGFAQFTGAGGFRPSRAPGKLLLCTYSVVVVVTLAGYTANLTAFFTADEEPPACESLYDCIHNSIWSDSICVEQGSKIHMWAANGCSPCTSENQCPYPVPCLGLEAAGRLVPILNDPFWGLRNGLCTNVLETRVMYDFATIDASINPDCNLRRVGTDVLRKVGGGWISKVDHDFKCTSVLIDALNYWMTELYIDGTITRILDNMKSSKTTQDCSAVNKPLTVSPLDIDYVSGVFVLHGCVLFLAVLYRLSRRFLYRCEYLTDSHTRRHPS